MNKLTNEEKYQRLNHLLDVLAISFTKFTELLNVKHGTYYNYVHSNAEKRTTLTDDAITIICSHFNIPTDYFLTDTMNIKDLVIDRKKFIVGKQEEYKMKEDAKQERKGAFKMKLLSENVAANFNTPIYQNNHFEEFFVSKSIFDRYAKSSFLAKVKGVSMVPVIPNNAIVVITKIENWKYIEHQIVAVAYDKMFTIKKIKKNDFESGFIILYPENPEYSELKIDIKEIHEVFKVERIIDAEFE